MPIEFEANKLFDLLDAQNSITEKKKQEGIHYSAQIIGRSLSLSLLRVFIPFQLNYDYFLLYIFLILNKLKKTKETSF